MAELGNPVEIGGFATMVPSMAPSNNVSNSPSPAPTTTSVPSGRHLRFPSLRPSIHYHASDGPSGSPTRLSHEASDDPSIFNQTQIPSDVPSVAPTPSSSMSPSLRPTKSKVDLRMYPTRGPTESPGIPSIAPTAFIPPGTWKNQVMCTRQADGTLQCGGDASRTTPIAVAALALGILLALILSSISLWRRRLYLLKCCRDPVAEPDGLHIVDEEDSHPFHVTTIEEHSDDDDDDGSDVAVEEVNVGHKLPPPRLECRRSILKPTMARRVAVTPSEKKRPRSTRRVRFNLPEQTPDSNSTAGSLDEAKPANGKTFSAKDDVDAWVSWVLNPLFDTSQICTNPNQICASTTSQPEEDDQVSLPSYESSATPSITSNEEKTEEKSGMGSFHSADWYFCLESASEQAAVDTDVPLPLSVVPPLEQSPPPPPPPAQDFAKDEIPSGVLGILDRREFVSTASSTVRRDYVPTLLESTPDRDYKEFLQPRPLTRDHQLLTSAKSRDLMPFPAGSHVDSPLFDSDEELDAILREADANQAEPKKERMQASHAIDYTFHTTEDSKEDLGVGLEEI